MVNPNSRLDADMEERRLEMNLEWRDIATRSGLSYETLRALRRTGRASALSKRRAEHALAWEPGSIDAIIGGGHAVALELSSPTGSTAQDLRRLIADLRDEIEYLSPRHERNRPYLVAHLERQIAELEGRLKTLESNE